MKKLFTKSAYAVLAVTFLMLGASQAIAQENVSSKIDSALEQKNLSEVQAVLQTAPGQVDNVIKALLKHTQKVLSQDPAFSNQMMALAGEYAPQITPPTVPSVCADLRRIIDAIPPDQASSPLYDTVVQAAEQFSKAPVVISSGRPNQCETAFLQIAALRGQDPLLAQMPGMTGPGLPPTTIRPGIPPTEPPPTDKPSAD